LRLLNIYNPHLQARLAGQCGERMHTSMRLIGALCTAYKPLKVICQAAMVNSIA